MFGHTRRKRRKRKNRYETWNRCKLHHADNFRFDDKQFTTNYKSTGQKLTFLRRRNSSPKQYRLVANKISLLWRSKGTLKYKHTSGK